MAGQTPINIVGTLGGDPEIRDAAGAQVASFSVAVSERIKQGDDWVDGPATWFRCSAWRDLGANVAASLHKGDRVILSGTIAERKYTDREGTEKTSWDVTVEAIGPELRFATASPQRVVKNQNQAQRREQYDQQNGRYPAGNNQPGRSPGTGRDTRSPQQQHDDTQRQAGWSPSAYDDETPF